MKFIVKNVPAIGNCLFEAVGRSIDVTAKDLRQKTVQWMIQPNQTLFGDSFQIWLDEIPIQKYANDMAREGTWGGGIELAIIAKLIHRPIIVFASNTPDVAKANRIAEFIPDTENNIELIEDMIPVCIFYVGGAHYMQIEIQP